MMISSWPTKIRLKRARVQAALAFFLLVVVNQSVAQFKPLLQSEAQAEMERFASGKKVLYMAAHPDDENTRLIAWLSNALDAETTYLSLTRGSGGQNLIGDELGADLGVMREHELRAARSVDGGNQRFTDALDFGYSKSVDEVWTKWDHDDLQLQTVRTIRELKPDFIITRFPPDERAGHGHHTASAELAMECAELAADENYDKETSPWKVEGVWWNTSVWWDPSLKDDSSAVRLDMSGFDPLLGETYGAIGDKARSMHKCQGFGVPINRGPREEYFKVLWGGGDLEGYLETEGEGFDERSVLAGEAAFALEIGDREQAIEKWATLGSQLLEEEALESDRYQRWQNVMLHLLGVYAEVYTTENPVLEGGSQTATVAVQAMNPLSETKVVSVKGYGVNRALNPGQPIVGEGFTMELDLGLKVGEPPTQVRVRLSHEESIIMLYLTPVAKLVDRAIGEYKEAIAVEPSLHAKFEMPVYWNTGKVSSLTYAIYSSQSTDKQWRLVAKDNQGVEQWSETVQGKLNEGWNSFEAVVPKGIAPGRYTVEVHVQEGANATVLHEQRIISYPHIGTHYRTSSAQSTLAVLDLNKKRVKVGYIEGAGDIMDETLESLGYEIVRISEDTPELWKTVEVILVGIRAFNTEKWLMDSGDHIQSFVAGGGNFVVTYTTAGRSGITLPTPVPLTIGRDRVTEEDAPIVLKDHPLLQTPNLLTEGDFDFWVQERGLYFPKSYEGYAEVLTITESTGKNYSNSTVVAHYEKGSVIYTGLSLFRELPKGVPGAMRLLQNILHYDH